MALSIASVVLLGTIDVELDDVEFALALALFGVGAGLLLSQLGNVIMSSVDPAKTNEAGGLQGTAQNLGASLGTALIGAVLIAALSTGFVERVEQNPEISPRDPRAGRPRRAKGVPVVSVDEAEDAALEAGASPRSREASRTTTATPSSTGSSGRSAPLRCSPCSRSGSPVGCRAAFRRVPIFSRPCYFFARRRARRGGFVSLQFPLPGAVPRCYFRSSRLKALPPPPRTCPPLTTLPKSPPWLPLTPPARAVRSRASITPSRFRPDRHPEAVLRLAGRHGGGGPAETIDDISPIETTRATWPCSSGSSSSTAGGVAGRVPEKDLTYARPLTVTVGFINRETGEIREQSVFMGDFRG